MEKDFWMLYSHPIIHHIHDFSILLVSVYLLQGGEQYYGASNLIHTGAVYAGQL